MKAILLSKSFQRKSSCFRWAFKESNPAFVELSMKVILLLLSFPQKSCCFRRPFKTTKFYVIVKNNDIVEKIGSPKASQSLPGWPLRCSCFWVPLVSEWPLIIVAPCFLYLSKQLSLLPLVSEWRPPHFFPHGSSAPGRSSGQPRQIYLWLTIGIIRLTRSSPKKLSTPSLFTEEPGPGPGKKVN